MLAQLPRFETLHERKADTTQRDVLGAIVDALQTFKRRRNALVEGLRKLIGIMSPAAVLENTQVLWTGDTCHIARHLGKRREIPIDALLVRMPESPFSSLKARRNGLEGKLFAKAEVYAAFPQESERIFDRTVRFFPLEQLLEARASNTAGHHHVGRHAAAQTVDVCLLHVARHGKRKRRHQNGGMGGIARLRPITIGRRRR